MTTAVIVQARMGSTRMPGKVMRELAGKPVLAHVLERCRLIPGADVVVCAVPDADASAPLEDVARQCGAQIYRGCEADVLDRYAGAARDVGADVILRVTSDCPFVDPEVCGQVLALRAEQDVDYAANNLPRTWPHGLDCEAFTRAVLERAASSATAPAEREHVTPWIRGHESIKRANLLCPLGDLSAHRWTLDYAEDLEFLRAVVDALGEPVPSWRAVLRVLDTHPALLAINARRIAS